MLPPSVAQLYVKNCDLPNYDTPNSNKLAVPYIASNVYWNKISDHLDTVISSLTAFKKNLRKYLLFNDFIV